MVCRAVSRVVILVISRECIVRILFGISRCAVVSGCSVARCLHPLLGYRSRKVGPSGKRTIVFSVAEGFVDLPVAVSCGQCAACRLERSRQWAVRCYHEASLYSRNAFITLTYSDTYLPPAGSLDKLEFPKFMKRLRKKFGRMRYFHCGEYGELLGRPHYHACLFGFDFPDKILLGSRKGFPVWRSPALEALWPFGRSEIGTVTFESAAYVARYIMKKVTGKKAEAHYVTLDLESGELRPVEPEYTTMSRRPGIGAGWFEKYGSEVFPSDTVAVGGKLMKPPKFYDNRFELLDDAGFQAVARKRRAHRDASEETPERLAAQEAVLLARTGLLERPVE